MKCSIVTAVIAVVLHLTAAQLTNDVTADIQGLSNAFAHFSELLYLKISDAESGNFVFSPLSLHSVLSLVALGATPNTTTFLELHRLLADSAYLINTKFIKAYGDLTSTYEKSTIAYATKIWISDKTQLKPKYKSILEKISVEAASLDFTDPNSTTQINQWTSNLLRGQIPSAIDEVSPLTECIITNGLYLNESWYEFQDDAEETTFYIERNRTTTGVVMMQRTGTDFMHATLRIGSSKHEVLKIPYFNEFLEMMIILPDHRVGLHGIQRELRSSRSFPLQETILLNKIFNLNYERKEMHVKLPKFSISSDFKVNEVLQKLGVKKVFTEESELGEMTTADQLRIDKIVHKTTIRVDKGGTVAASVSAIEIVPFSVSTPEEFVVDRPFMFVVWDDKNKVPLITGRVVDPNALL